MATHNTSARSSAAPGGTGRADPFAPGVNAFFQEVSRVQQLDLLYALLCYGHSPLVLLGPLGAGKTTLLSELQKRLAEHLPTALLTGYPELTVDPLLDEAQRQFTVALSTRGSAFGGDGVMGAVMLVDDADTLSDVVLRVLLTPSSSQGGGQVRVLLAGTQPLVQRIAPMVDALVPMVRVLELPPFSAADSARFVGTRLAAVGIHAHPLLLPLALQQLHQDAGGWPGAIVSYARAALASAGSRPPRATVAPRKAARVGGGRLGFFLQGFRQAVHSQWLWPIFGALSVALLLLLWPQKKPLPPPPPTALSTLAPPPVRVAEPEHTSSPNTPAVAAPEAPPTAVAPLATPTPATGAVPSVVVALAANPPPKALAPPVAPVAQPAVAPAKGSANTTTPTAAASPAPIAPAAVATPAPTPTPPATVSGDQRSNEWLRTQLPGSYTLQLMSGNGEEPVRVFMREWGLSGDKLTIAHTRRSGRDWYSLLYGVYANQRQAEEAAKQLPHGVGRPWIRTVGSVQQDLPRP